MSLVNFPKVRIKEYSKGYAVEIQKTTWYGRKYWVNIISYTGIPSEPYLFNHNDTAIDVAQKHFKWHIMDNFNS